jgi:hypothetical protein
MKKQRRSRGSVRSIISLAISVGLIFAAFLLWTNKQYVIDWISFRQYEPSAEVQSIAQKTTMTDDGTFYFYASQPQIQSAQSFNQSCERKEASSAILGCYANNKIYVYDIQNPDLSGIKEVTSAHEMLHAVYQRMSSEEKQRVNALLESEYEKAKEDPSLAERMAFYAKYEAGEKYNELHSIVGTEFASISPELEAYYKKYFSNRQAVTQLHDSYASVFESLKSKSAALLSQLQKLGPQLEQDSEQYNADARTLQSDIQSFNQRATSGSFSGQGDVFTVERNRLVARSEALDARREQYNRDVARYEQLRQEYNSTAASSQELYESLDSKLAPSPNV